MSFNTIDKGSKIEQNSINNGLTHFRNQLNLFKNDAYQFKNNEITLKELQQSLKDTRNAYKKIEFFLAYYYPEFAKTKINAAPLFRLEAAGTKAYTLPPEGLQVLDEMVYMDDATEQADEIIAITEFLVKNYTNFYLSAIKNGTSTTSNQTLPLRSELIRIYSMGITGFDTPGSLNTSEEAYYALDGMENFIKESPYFKNFNTREVQALLKKTKNYLLQNTDFETFDRIVFYKDYLQPLYEKIGSWDGRKDDLAKFSGWNPESKHLFSSDFLDSYFYTLLKKEDDSKALQNLGRELFFDASLSNNNTMSCATCHQPANAFTDQKVKSESNVLGTTVLRNSPSLYNAVFAKRFFYDMRAFYLEQQVEHVIYNDKEYNTTYEQIVKKLDYDPKYKAAFQKVFKNSKVDKQNFSLALSSYVASLNSFDSTFDRFMRGEIDVNQTVKDGYNLFMGKANCATCHFAPHFSGLVPPFYNENESEVLGVTENPINSIPRKLDQDLGRANSQVKKEESWIYNNSFKTTTVRNVALTAPYFHNGGFKALEEVIDFYNEGGGEGLGLSVTNQTLPSDQLNLTPYEKQAVISFLKSLTDVSKK